MRYVIVITQDEYDIFVVTRVQSLRMSVNNKDIIRMYLDYNLLISQRPSPIKSSVYNEYIYTMASTGSVTYQSFVCTVAYIS